MKHKLLLLFVCFSFVSFSQEKFTISGTITDGETGEDVFSATVLAKDVAGKATTSNIYGFYSLTLPKGEYTIVYRSFGYTSKEYQVNLDKDVKYDLELLPETTNLKGIVIKDKKDNDNITSTDMGVEKLKVKDLDAIPVLFGEKDIIKTVQLLPGVKSAGEGSSGFYVRGGGADQNLILLDGAPVYNASHLLGFFSVFNSDALKDVKLYKGLIPAEFGGRLSSVMDVKMKEGNSKKLSVSGGLGLISSKLTVEAPIVKDKGSFIISGRRTYADAFLKLSKDTTLNKSILYFYDFNAKANYKLGEKDRIFVSGYFGRDNFGFADQFGFDWGNATGTVRWNHIYNSKLFSNTSAIFSNYNYKIKFGGEEGFGIGSKIQDINVKHDFEYYANDKNTMRFGANVIHHTFKPGDVETGDDINFELNDIENRQSIESAVYFSNDQKLSNRIKLNYGLRYSNFTQFGANDIFTYDNDGNVIDTTSYAKGEVIKSYNGLAPRFGMNYTINEESSIKASVSRTYQYLHLISNSTSSSPTDVWLPSSNNILPEIGDQVSLGYFRNFKKDMYQFSAEAYYKDMQNTLDYRDGAETTLNPTLEGELLTGIGRAYGLELLLKKKTGKFSGWVSYTISKTEKKFDEINNGTWFSAKQDRTHDVSLVGIYNLSDRWTFSATWVYYTGNAVTFPSGKYNLNGNTVYQYTERNGYRMPDYHRMDIGATLNNKKFKTVKDVDSGEEKEVEKRFQSSWNFSVYNLYGRENAYSISFRENASGQTEAVQVALFKMIPSISYNFKF